ncbi:V-type ATP synthase subunit C [Methanocaldococcus lauensis]|uniref:A-type ATP synthase subunit C n=1 Tax=Methanocaldococcus lauensis TaxID=2546128 RepID=A0A8D6SV14_9EURY|nr:V-type ATP synthase subunit C [Methanocaldococcus lauensis]CAB3287158.1 V-type ATP synthase subunit C [Methanocaldococcus lauensis]CAB3287923.1 V-type ATP synthase subunit C [Methanocaldococcus lauensis]
MAFDDIGILLNLKTLYSTLMTYFDNPLTILIVIATIIIVVTVIVWIVKMVIDLAPYAYVNARIRSKEAKLLDNTKLNELIESGSLEEMIGILEDTDYGQYISEVLNELKDPIAVEKALDMYLADLYNLIFNISPESAKNILKVFSKKFDIKNIKTLIRAKYYGLNAEETYSLLIPLGNIPIEKLKELSEAKTVEEVVRGLDGTEYFKVLQEELSNYEQTSSITGLELALDRYYLNELRKVMMIEGKEEDLFREFIGTLIDVENLKVILKGKADGLSADELSKYVSLSGYELPEWKLKDLMSAEGIEGILSGLEGTSYANVLSEYMEEFEKTKSVFTFEKALDRFILEKGKKLSVRKPFGVGPIIGLIVSKELEVKNLKAIIKGKIENLKPDEIRRLLISL